MRMPVAARSPRLPLTALAVVTALAAGCSSPVEPAPATRRPAIERPAATAATPPDTTTKTTKDGGTIPWY